MLRKLLRPPRETGPIRTSLASLLPPAVATGFGLALQRTAPVTAASVYMLAVVVAAALGGVRGGLGAALLSGLALNFFFTPPKYTVRVEKVEDVVSLIVFLVVASIVGSLLARAIEERERASRRERETRLLNYFATKLLSGEPLERMMSDFAAALLEPFGLVRAEIQASAEGWSFAAAAGSDDEEGPRSTAPIVVGKMPFGELTVIGRKGAEALHGADLRLLESCAKQAAVALERARLDAQVEGARLDSETSQLRAALFSSVTHDLRTPLASIKASVTSLLDTGASHDADQERDLLRTVLEETDRLNRLVGNILDLAKVRAGALVPAKVPTAIDEVIESVLHRIAPALANVHVRTLVRPDLPEVPVDPVQVDQVLTNLLENAARFSPRGGEILVSASPWQGAIQVRVADQGPGIPPEDRKVVFEALYRRDAGEGRGGSGLGLAIARAIVVAHGGRIWVEGVPSGGTAVVFELPLTDAGPAKEEP